MHARLCVGAHHHQQLQQQQQFKPTVRTSRANMQLLFVVFCLLHCWNQAAGDCGCKTNRKHSNEKSAQLSDSVDVASGPSTAGPAAVHDTHEKTNIIPSDTTCGAANDSENRQETGSTLSSPKSCSMARGPDGEQYCEAEGSPERQHSRKGMVFVEGGEFIMGTDNPVIVTDGEHPARRTYVKPFWLDEMEVSNADFEAFVAATGYKTEAEKFGDSSVLNSTIKDHSAAEQATELVPWWYTVKGADWRHPEGPGSDISNRMDYPATHVSWNDATAYCKWRGARLPREFEWEKACKTALGGMRFPWGNSVEEADNQRSANIWQGTFPTNDTGADGFKGTSPVHAFPYMKGLPVKNMIGNVWEWVEDIWSTEHAGIETTTEPSLQPTVDGASGEPDSRELRVKKGGSFMCHASYCFRFRCEARSENTVDTTSSNLGFRCAADAVAE